MNDKNPVLILGAGLAGLSASYHLKGPSIVVEKSAHVGGTARSFEIDGFTFDITGHLLHLHNPYTKKLITALLRNEFYRCIRKTWIFSNNTYTHYPFQANTFGLPDTVVDECVFGFFDSCLKPNGNMASADDLQSWSERVFGSGITRHFMRPYNEKLYQTKTNAMTTEWCGPFVPKPHLEDLIRGALTEDRKAFGYNATFLYPKKGGIQQLALAMATSVRDIRFGTSVASIDWRKKCVTLDSGDVLAYSNLVNTIPLTDFLDLMDGVPADIRAHRKKLKFASILCLNLGVNRPKISDASWIYFPEDKFPFYRIGFPMNFTPHVVPKGCSSMYVEIPMNILSRYKSPRSLLADVKRALIQARILKPSDRFPVIQRIPVKHAYVIYDQHRVPALKAIFSFFKKNNILSIGRYGAWKYSFMEEAILDGKKAAETIQRELR